MNYRHIAYTFARNRLCPLMQYAQSGRVHSEAHRERLLQALSKLRRGASWSLELEEFRKAVARSLSPSLADYA